MLKNSIMKIKYKKINGMSTGVIVSLSLFHLKILNIYFESFENEHGNENTHSQFQFILQLH